MIISGLCVLHCLAVPIVLILFPSLGLSIFPQEDITHVVLLAFILGVAGIAFVTGYRVHGQWRPVAWLVAGLAFVFFATFFVHNHMGHMWEPVFAIAGSICLIRAHYLNHQCKKCEHEHHKHES
jgi:MerC mercury resistance protein